MSRKTRRNFSPEFKAKVALEALREQQTMGDLASKYELHPTQISDWKKQLLSSSAELFKSGKDIAEPPDTTITDELYKTIGQLKMENDWLKKKSDQLFVQNKKNGIGR